MKTRNRTRLRVEELENRCVPATHSFSTNWAGYAVSAGAGAVSRVEGHWVVPAVATNVSGYSSAWVGIDGFNSSSVEQIGTDSDFVNGVARYYAWWEMYPAGSVNINGLSINPGDSISASVTYSAPNQFILSISDDSNGGSFTTTQSSSSAQLSSAEWIQEAPSSFTGVLPLANFGTIKFSGANATVNGTTGPADNGWAGTTLNQIDMVTRNGKLKATTSAITDSGTPTTSSFSVTWVSSGSSGGGGGGGHGHKSVNVPVSALVSMISLTAPAVIDAGASLPASAASTSVDAARVPTLVALIAQPAAPVLASVSTSAPDGPADADPSDPPKSQPGDVPAPENPELPPKMEETFFIQADGSLDALPPANIAAGPDAAPSLSSDVALPSISGGATSGVLSGDVEWRDLAMAGLALTLAFDRAWAHTRKQPAGKGEAVRPKEKLLN